MGTTVKFLKKVKLKKPILLIGLPGIGLVGKIAVDYLLKQVKTQKIAEIYSSSFPPSVHTKESVMDLIKDEIFLFSCKGQDFLILAGPVQPSLDFRTGLGAEHYEFAEKISKAMKDFGVKEVYTLAGINIGDKRLNQAPRIVCAVTSEKLLKDLKKFGAIQSDEEGLVSGAAGLIPGMAKEFGIEGACLMGETNAKLIYGDQGAAKKVLELLVKKFGFKINLGQIEKEAKEIEKAFKHLNEQLEEEAEEEKPDKLSYVR